MPLAAIAGNDDARRSLLASLRGGRLPHALLFHGPRGVGKHRVALALAEALLCPQASPDACGACDVCRRVAAGVHPDLVTVERDGQFVRVEAARELVRESFLRPYEGRAKVFVVPEAECLNEDAANTLLKTLEEPPPSTYIVLVTTSREGVLPTIRSRCQAIAFRPLDKATLARRLGAEEGLAPADAELRARLAGAGDHLAAADLTALRALRAQALPLVQALARGELDLGRVDALLELAQDRANEPGGVERYLDLLRTLGRDALLLAERGDPRTLVHAEAAAEIEPLGRALGAAGAASLLADIDEAEGDLKVNANRRLLLEAVLLGVYERGAGSGAR